MNKNNLKMKVKSKGTFYGKKKKVEKNKVENKRERTNVEGYNERSKKVSCR